MIFCIAQMLVLIFILLQKRYRVLPNFFLGLIFGILILHIFYYLLISEGYLDHSQTLSVGLKSISFFPPIIIFMYVNLVITGYLMFSWKQVTLMFTGFFLAMILLVIFILEGYEDKIGLYNSIISEIIIINFLVYTYLIFKTLALFCGTEQGIISVFRFSNPRFNWLKIIAVMLSIDMLLQFFKIHFDSLIPLPENWYEMAMSVFLIILSYVFLYGIINYPEVIHIDRKQIGLNSAKKYARPNLSKKESEELMKKMNAYMDKYKPWLIPEFCMADFSQKLAVSGHLISEVTNGLMKQHFFDYVNNYRIEEFKRLLEDPEKKDDKIQFLAYDSGFNSKTTFNTAFKKFTGQTPSVYKRNLKSK